MSRATNEAVKPGFRPSHKVAKPRRPEKGADFGVK